jgi:hypothetical protein
MAQIYLASFFTIGRGFTDVGRRIVLWNNVESGSGATLSAMSGNSESADSMR